MVAMMTALQRQIEERIGGEREQRFYSNVLSSLSTASKTTVQLERWMITSYEVEFGRKIGFGGLFVVFFRSSYIKRLILFRE